jgi:hypothetical protein
MKVEIDEGFPVAVIEVGFAVAVAAVEEDEGSGPSEGVGGLEECPLAALKVGLCKR